MAGSLPDEVEKMCIITVNFNSVCDTLLCHIFDNHPPIQWVPEAFLCG